MKTYYLHKKTYARLKHTHTLISCFSHTIIIDKIIHISLTIHVTHINNHIDESLEAYM